MKLKDITYVSIQFILFIIYALTPAVRVFYLPVFLKGFALAIAILGGLVLLIALLQLNKNLSPFPTPKTKGKLITIGLYRWVRHPIYSGILLFVFGDAIFNQSWSKLVISFLLLGLFYFKSVYEEDLLKQKFSDYADYQKRTGRFFPFL